MGELKKKNWLAQMSNWYFSKRVLPYWCILLLDTLIVFFSCVFCYWVQNRMIEVFNHRDSVFITSVFYALLGWIGAIPR